MDRQHRLVRAAGLIALGLAAAAAGAQDRQVYRYTEPDGRVVYSDRPPPGEAKNVQQKRVGGNFVEGGESVATRQASERFPVTLFTFPCGEPCQSAEGLLNKRGVPFTIVNAQDANGAQKLQQLTGELTVPVLQVGDKMFSKGFSEQRWQALLDEAGYPKTPPNRRTALTGADAAKAEAAAGAAPPAGSMAVQKPAPPASK